MRSCKKCGVEKSVGEFYIIRRGGLEKGRDSTCSDCRRTSNRERYRDPEVLASRRLQYAENRKNLEYVDNQRQYLVDYYNTPQGRAKTLMKSINKRSKSDRFCDTNITEEFILGKLNSGKCEVTGIPFEYENTHGTFKNPFSPSIDRINPSIGYLMDNVRVVIWQVNLMKGELTDEQFLSLFKKFYESLTGEVKVDG